MSDSDSGSRRPTVFDKHMAGKWMVLAGNCEVINSFLEDQSTTSVWILAMLLNSVLRSFGQVIFANNPISGLLIVLAIGIADYRAMFASLLTSSLSFIFAAALQQDSSANLNGVYGYNAVLHAVVSVGLLPYIYDNITVNEPRFWFFLIMATLISIYVTSAMMTIFAHLGQHPVPCFTLPFNVLQFILIFCLLHNRMPSEILSKHLIEPPENRLSNGSQTMVPIAVANNETFHFNVTEPLHLNETTGNHHRKRKSHNRRHNLRELDRIRWTRSLPESISPDNATDNQTSRSAGDFSWGNTFSGTIVALSQVYGLNNIPCAALMYLALVIYSPITAGFTYIGSIFATLIGTLFASNPEDIYNGIWAYNGMLCAGGLAGFGFVLTLQSAFLSLVAVVFSTALQHVMMPWFQLYGIPLLTLPFNITTILFLYVTSGSEKALVRPSEITFPEKHLQDFNVTKRGQFQGYLRRVRLGEIFSRKDEV